MGQSMARTMQAIEPTRQQSKTDSPRICLILFFIEREEDKMANRTSKTATGRGRATVNMHDGNKGDGHTNDAQPLLHQRGIEIQKYGSLRNLPIALSESARSESCELLNQVLADTIILYNL